MKIENDKVVTFYYSLKDDAGETLENLREGDPKAYLHGRRNMMPALEKEFSGREAGDTFVATLAPEQAYGMRREVDVVRVPVKHLLTKGKLKPGMVVSINSHDGAQQATVVKVGKFNVDVDSNHPLAGKTLTFDVEIVEVRDASAEELSHGHSHGAGGHQH
ncbi:MAG: peptidylprolyl isomerase [Porticoccaceae bacterium]|nr:peptidylprolyl isomerase [Porticoccaceae bacterium]